VDDEIELSLFDDEEHTAHLETISISPADEALPDDVLAFLADADKEIEAFFSGSEKDRRFGFFPSDYPFVYSHLLAVRQLDEHARRFCEWGSGFGVVTGLADFLGFESCGIEIDSRFIESSRELLSAHGREAEIFEGDFIPEEFTRTELFESGGRTTFLSGMNSLDEVDVDIDDFDVIFAFPWPDEEEMYRSLFLRYAANGSLLVTFHALEEVRVYRKLAHRG